jgi:TetR/AcrR family transcriptional regulator, repressor of fatR-cypB operon
MTKASSRTDRSRPFYVHADDPPAKHKILVTALALFVRDGLCETSVRDIANASGFTNPALFKHFESKDHLARFLFERCYLELADLVETAAASGTTFRQKQRAVIEAYLEALDRDSDTVLYVQDFLRHFWPLMPAAVKRHSIVGEVRKMLAAGRSDGTVTISADIELVSTAWIGTLQQFARARYFGEFKGQSVNELAAALDALLSKMVRP